MITMVKKFVIEQEAADSITVSNLKEFRTYLKKELKDYKNGSYLHADDVVQNAELIKALDLVIKSFGKD